MKALVLARWALLSVLVLSALLLPAAAPAGAQSVQQGRLVIIGGGLSRDTEAVYRAVLDGRSGAGPLCVIPTAGADPDAAIASTVQAFERYGGAGVAEGVLITTDRPEAAVDDDVVAHLLRCSGFYFTGGVQSRIVRVFRPDGRSTPAYDAVLRRFREGAVVSGSSAGAAIMSDPMIAGGSTTTALRQGIRRAAAAADDSDDDNEGAVAIMPGMGFLPAIVDQHFLARGRIGRLITAVLELDEFDIGFGIDENTALVVDGASVHPVGASGVVVIDARRAARDGRSVTGLDLHLLGAGDRYDLGSGRVAAAEDKRSLAPGTMADSFEIFERWSFLHLLHQFAASQQADVSVHVDGAELVIRRGPGFAASSAAGTGVQQTPAALSVTGMKLDVRR